MKTERYIEREQKKGGGQKDNHIYEFAKKTFWLLWLSSVAMAALSHTSWTGGEMPQHMYRNTHTRIYIYFFLLFLNNINQERKVM